MDGKMAVPVVVEIVITLVVFAPWFVVYGFLL